MKNLYIVIAFFLFSPLGKTQIDDSQLGGWYMYFWKADFAKDSKFGMQGDLQLRNWAVASDLEQLLLRGGFTYQANDKVLLTLGYGNITTGEFGESSNTVSESRIYQEALISNKLSKWVRLKHRFRYEQRWAGDNDMRTRYRYNLFVTIPFTQKLLSKGGTYLSLYNELFINGERSIDSGDTFQFFDRNRLYAGIGYVINDKHKTQLGIMNQKTDKWSKYQLQVSVHSSF